MTAAEFKFLRKHLGWASQDLARKFGVDPSTVSRWENEAEPLSRWADRLIRLAVAKFTPVDDYSAEDMDLIDASAGAVQKPLRLQREHGGWRGVESYA
ncbi:MAG TPA: helix-turn-helix domain-containing protein [Nannocystis sp.]